MTTRRKKASGKQRQSERGRARRRQPEIPGLISAEREAEDLLAELDRAIAADPELAAAVAEAEADPERSDATWLLSTIAVSERCQSIVAAGLADELEHFGIVEDRLDETAAYVCRVMEDRFPDLSIPPHSRWRHFVVDGRDLWQELEAGLDDPDEIARIRFDLAVTSVLLDAGAGSDWRYRHAPTGVACGRSEGLALASFEAFRSGLFSSDRDRPLMADAAGLKALTTAKLAAAFQVDDHNPLPGIAQRTELLRRLGSAMEAACPADSGYPPRPAALFEALLDLSLDGEADMLSIITLLQMWLGEMWGERERLGGTNLGDTWRHPRAGGEGPGAGLVPFHKLVQWIAYSLVEPLEAAGLTVVGTELLTPLAEYRNGGLLIDCGVIAPRHQWVTGTVHKPGDEVVVEWRALTVALIAVLAEAIRDRYGVDETELPLAAILEGGTWWAGRMIAADKRPGGGPPIAVASDGTVF